MKRSSSAENHSSSKRQQTLGRSLFDNPELKRIPAEIHENGTDGTGYLSGRVLMLWPPMGKKLRAIFQTRPDEQHGPQQFEVEFRGEFFKELNFKVHDQILLALKGAKKVPDASKLKLQYEKGILVKLVTRPGDLQLANTITDTWECGWLSLAYIRCANSLFAAMSSPPSSTLSLGDFPSDWFSTPDHKTITAPTPTSFVSPETVASTTALPGANPVIEPTSSVDSNAQYTFPSVSIDDDDPFNARVKVPQSHLDIDQSLVQTIPPIQPLTKKQQRLQKKKQQKLEKAHIPPQPPVVVSIAQATPVSSNAEKSITSTPALPGPSRTSTLNVAPSKAPLNVAHTTPMKAEPPGGLSLKAGLMTERGVSSSVSFVIDLISFLLYQGQIYCYQRSQRQTDSSCSWCRYICLGTFDIQAWT
jgi:hypothetical protein